MKSVKETDGIVEKRTVLCINQAQEGDEAGATNRFKVVKVTDRQGRGGIWRQDGRSRVLTRRRHGEAGTRPYSRYLPCPRDRSNAMARPRPLWDLTPPACAHEGRVGGRCYIGVMKRDRTGDRATKRGKVRQRADRVIRQ